MTDIASLAVDKPWLMLGDCVERMREIPDGSVDLTVTSPPYDKLRTYNGYSFDFEGVARELYRVTKSGGVVVWIVGDATVNGNETGTSFRQALHFKDIGFNLHDTMIYRKMGGGACGSNYAYFQQFEYMFVLSKGRPTTFNRLGTGRFGKKSGGSRIRANGSLHRNKTLFVPEGEREISRGNVWDILAGNNGDDNTCHPAKFPESLARDHIASWSAPGDTVLDPFLGSGTTGKMAVLAGRKFIGCEISEQYLKDIARPRIAAAIAAALEPAPLGGLFDDQAAD